MNCTIRYQGFALTIQAGSEQEGEIVHTVLQDATRTSIQVVQDSVQQQASGIMSALSALTIESSNTSNRIITGTSSKWYPQWEAGIDGCKNDCGQPFNMQHNPDYLYNSKEGCCSAYYFWMLKECLADSNDTVEPCPEGTFLNTNYVPSSRNGEMYFPDIDGAGSCVKEFMLAWPSAWLYDSQYDCCIDHYQWKMDSCLRGEKMDQLLPTLKNYNVFQSLNLPTRNQRMDGT